MSSLCSESDMEKTSPATVAKSQPPKMFWATDPHRQILPSNILWKRSKCWSVFDQRIWSISIHPSSPNPFMTTPSRDYPFLLVWYPDFSEVKNRLRAPAFPKSNYCLMRNSWADSLAESCKWRQADVLHEELSHDRLSVITIVSKCWVRIRLKVDLALPPWCHFGAVFCSVFCLACSWF